MNKKHLVSLGIILGCLAIVGITTTFAYFVATINKNNTNQTGITAGSIGSIKYEGETTFNETNIYPGMKAVQTFTIEKGSQEGKGIYEIDLEGILPEVFGSDVEITLYKTTDPVTNNVVREEGSLTQTSEGFIKEDNLVVNGSPEVVYGPASLTNSSEIILEQADFDTETLQKKTYYLVYNYKNNGNQNNQKGQTFSGKVTVKLINEKQKTFPLATEYILAKGENEELKFDETTDNNLRYIGADPNNYVSFNNELWRIIGVMNNIDDGTGKKETRLKIIRDEPIGEYSWDNKASGTGSSTSQYGSNDWSDSTLQIVLNEGAYWNRTSGDCPYGRNGATTSCDFSSNGLTNEAKEMIENALWNLGGSSTSEGVTTNMFYEREREKDVYEGRPTEWIGKIGLMYASDYGFATSGGSITNRETCLSTELNNWNFSDCNSNDWLLDGKNNQWLLNSLSSISTFVFYVRSYAVVNSVSPFYNHGVYPSLYLSSSVKISGGEGTSDNPYVLSL